MFGLPLSPMSAGFGLYCLFARSTLASSVLDRMRSSSLRLLHRDLVFMHLKHTQEKREKTNRDRSSWLALHGIDRACTGGGGPIELVREGAVDRLSSSRKGSIELVIEFGVDRTA
ncbi:unnamed protein product [Microthlaspi erraticum]|uniref:Uncharacterized protein n=1 Tax=Microthlaspi erraticum TaxID=1685480 RepID=A0A6D2I5D8_9BRAS|nr:unnamed protein product [Microthlaspi erraticum]